MDWCYFPSSHRLEPKWLLEISPVFSTIHPPLDWSNIPTLVGGALTIVRNMKVNGKDDIPYMKWKIKNSWLKPPTSLHLIGLFFKHVGFKTAPTQGTQGSQGRFRPQTQGCLLRFHHLAILVHCARLSKRFIWVFRSTFLNFGMNKMYYNMLNIVMGKSSISMGHGFHGYVK